VSRSWTPSWLTWCWLSMAITIYKCILALNLLGISCLSEYLSKDMVHQTYQHIQQLKVQKPMIDLIDMGEWVGSNNIRRYTVSIIDL